MQTKHTLYVIGGIARTGKSIVAAEVVRRKHLVFIATDGIRAAIRKVLLGESHVSVDKVRFQVQATFRRPGSLTQHVIRRAERPKGEDELAWTGVRGLIETYDRKNIVDVLVEGIAVTPERLHRLKLKNLRVKAIFVGYSDKDHAASILRYARAKHDWVYTWLKEHGGDEALVHNWVRKGISRSKKLRYAAKKYGYTYISLDKGPFSERVRAAVRSLLG